MSVQEPSHYAEEDMVLVAGSDYIRMASIGGGLLSIKLPTVGDSTPIVEGVSGELLAVNGGTYVDQGRLAVTHIRESGDGTGISLPGNIMMYNPNGNPKEITYSNDIPIRLNTFDVSLNGHDDRLNGLDISVNIIDVSLNIIDVSLNGLDISVNIIDVSLNIHDDRLNGLDISVNIIDVSLNIHDASLNGLDISVNIIDVSLNMIDSTLYSGSKFAIGAGSSATGTNSFAIGNNATTLDHDNAVAIGNEATTTANDEIGLGNASVSKFRIGGVLQPKLIYAGTRNIAWSAGAGGSQRENIFTNVSLPSGYSFWNIVATNLWGNDVPALNEGFLCLSGYSYIQGGGSSQFTLGVNLFDAGNTCVNGDPVRYTYLIYACVAIP